jgi:hypothetical protein
VARHHSVLGYPTPLAVSIIGEVATAAVAIWTISRLS